MKVFIKHANAEVDFPDDLGHDAVIKTIQEQFPAPPNHDDLEGAAVTGEDSLDLQDMDSSIKPAVKMTLDELKRHESRIQHRLVVIWKGVAYVIDPDNTDPEDVIEGIMNGNDSKMLGYPERGNHHVAVTRQGEVVEDLNMMKKHAESGNCIWACCGNQDEARSKAEAVAAVVKKNRVKRGKPPTVKEKENPDPLGLRK